MKLSAVVEGLSGVLVSDGNFYDIAFATEKERTGFLTFLEKEKFAESLQSANISCVLTTPELRERIPSHIQGVFLCERPKETLFAIHNRLAKDETYVGKSFPTKIGKNCNISPLAYIAAENIEIGNNVTIEPFAVIKGRTHIGDNVIIRSHVTVGCKGFSFSKNSNGENVSVIDTAQIVIEDNVELFEHVTVSTGIFPWEKTIIGKNTKVDTQSFVAHGCKVGKNCLLVAGSICCGNCNIGDNVWIGAGAILSNRIAVGNKARVSLGAVVTKDVPVDTTVSGNFAIDHQIFLTNLKQSLLREYD